MHIMKSNTFGYLEGNNKIPVFWFKIKKNSNSTFFCVSILKLKFQLNKKKLKRIVFFEKLKWNIVIFKKKRCILSPE